MKPQILFTESAGRTIEAISAEDDTWLITFTDGTFAAIAAYDGDVCDCHTVWLPELSESTIIRLRIAAADELAELKAQREELWRQSREEEERRHYERLKAKFGE